MIPNGNITDDHRSACEVNVLSDRRLFSEECFELLGYVSHDDRLKQERK